MILPSALAALRPWFAKHRLLLIDLLILYAAFVLTERYLLSVELPWLPQLIALAVALFLPIPAPDPAVGPLHSIFKRGRIQALACAIIAALWYFVFSLPLISAGFAVFWLVGAIVNHLCALGYFDPVLAWLEQRTVARRFDILLGESMLVTVVIFASGRLAPGLWPASFVPVAVVAWAVMSYALRLPDRAPGRHLLGSVAAFTALLAVAAHFTVGSKAAHAPALAWLAGSLLSYRWLLARTTRDDAQPARENYRWLLLMAAGCILFYPFLQPAVHGTGDALWYATMLADMLAQVRSGVFPVFVGQSIYQFNGAIYPVRVAPAFHHLGALTDLLTGCTLAQVSVLNALLFGTGMLALVTSYLSLRLLLPTARWLACGLAILYVSCPGTLGIVFNTDLFMSWMTVPWLPVALCGCVLSFRQPDTRALLLLAGGLGLLWWGHSPIALWTTIILALVQLVRVLTTRPSASMVGPLVAAAALFGALVAYPIGSVLLYPPEPGVNAAGFQEATSGTIVYFLREVRPAVWLPLSANGRALGDFQLGYALWVTFAATLWLAVRRRSLALLLLPLAAGALAVLLNIPKGPDEPLWHAIPDFVRNTTGNWVMNRLYLIQAGIIVFAAAALFASRLGAAARPSRILSIVLACGVLWALAEAGKYARGSHQSLRPPESGLQAMLPENIQITRFAYLVFPRLPGYFTHGVTDPFLENRLFTSAGAPLADNFSAAAHGIELGVYTFTSPPPTEGNFLGLTNPLRLQPGHHYAIVVEFNDAIQPKGIFQLKGTATLREYALPDYGEAASFGFGARHSRILSLPNNSGVPEDITVRFFPADTSVNAATLESFARVRWVEYQPSSLPVRVENWIPYRARVTAPEPAWLETPRMFQPAYSARVNGAPAALKKSAEGLVSISVPAGDSTVEVSYLAPNGLLALYWCSFVSVAGWLAWIVYSCLRKAKVPVAA